MNRQGAPAGDLDERVTLQRPEPARNATGEEVRAWASAGDVWAKVEEVGGREAWWAYRRQAVATCKVTIRAGGPQVTEQWRVLYRGRELEVTNVMPAGERRELLMLLCLETRR